MATAQSDAVDILFSNGIITGETSTGFPLLSVPNLDAWTTPVGCPHHVKSDFQVCDDTTVSGTTGERTRNVYNTLYVHARVAQHQSQTQF